MMESLQLAKMIGLSALLASCTWACSGSDSPAGDEIVIGLLLPFTGSSSGTASNFERAAIYAVNRVNNGGGIDGKRVRLVSQDTHSDVERSRSSAQALIDVGAIAILGPESADVANAIKPMLDTNGVAFLSPLIGAANDADVDCTHPWFRLAPSSRALGQALAKELFNQSVRTVAVLYETDTYNQALRDAASARFGALGGTVTLAIALDPNLQSYSSVAEQLLRADADAVLLATSPRTGALVVNEIGAASIHPPRLFLSPLLKTDVFLQNVAPEAVEGAVGVTPKIYATNDDFPRAFAARWQGDVPLEGAYFYYDAIGVLSLAAERCATQSTSHTPEALQAAIVKAAAPPGESTDWNAIESALARGAQGNTVYYSGLTGPLFFGACGSRQSGTTATWQVRAGSISDWVTQ